MVASLIVFGFPLHLWTGLTIFLTSMMLSGGIVIPKEDHVFENNADVWSIAVTGTN